MVALGRGMPAMRPDIARATLIRDVVVTHPQGPGWTTDGGRKSEYHGDVAGLLGPLLESACTGLPVRVEGLPADIPCGCELDLGVGLMDIVLPVCVSFDAVIEVGAFGIVVRRANLGDRVLVNHGW